jgi:cytosine/adenosine deaminase-related metal-dependent hydrolase
MRRLSAEWILPIAGEPIHQGVVTIEGGRVVGVGQAAGADAISLGHVAILPGLVNAHTHLELSYLAGRIPPARSFLDWVRPMLAARQQDRADDPAVVDGIRAGIAQSRAAGTALVGDVSNTLATVTALRQSALGGRVFYELIGFGPADVEERVGRARAAIDALDGETGGVRLSLAPHAPYSVSPALFAAIRADLDAHPGSARSTVHLGESPEELEFLLRGTGAWRAVLEELRAWNDDWRPPGTSPAAYLAGLGFLDSRTLVVHGVQLDGEDLHQIANAGATIVSCPRSNVHVGVGSPPLEAFYAMHVDVAFGTDSLASVDDLSIFAELAEARRVAPRVPARTLLESATLVGARALGLDGDFGSIEPGKRASLIAVRIPEGTRDVEEYLASGVTPEAVTWLEDDGDDV